MRRFFASPAAPAAVTAAVVSMFPPIHAPATGCSSPSPLATSGSRKIDGNAKMITRLAV